MSAKGRISVRAVTKSGMIADAMKKSAMVAVNTKMIAPAMGMIGDDRL